LNELSTKTFSLRYKAAKADAAAEPEEVFIIL